MTSRRLLAGITACAVIALAPVAAMLPADAADGGHGNSGSPQRLPSAQGTTTPPAPTPFVTTAKCPAGQRVVSGGFRGSVGVDVIASRRTAPDTWTVKAPYEQLRAFVTCSSTVSPTAVKLTEQFPADSSQKLVVTARCPVGKQAVSGGFEYVDDTANSPVFSSHPVTGRGWETQAFSNDERGARNSLNAFAYCAPINTVVRTAISPEGDEDTPKSVAQASCQDSETVLGGGFATNPESDYNNDTGPDFFYFGSLALGGRTWKVQAANYGQPGTATAYAVCAD